jgi:hypothetical protein
MPDQAALKLSRCRPWGGLHMRDRSWTSAKVLKELTNSTYTGIRNRRAKLISRA